MNVKKLAVVKLFIFFTLFSVGYVEAEVKTFVREYTYQASEVDSKVSCRAIALEQVKRLLLEELGTYLESHTEVINFQLTKDQITALAAGIVKTQIIKEKWDGEKYWLQAKIDADPNEVAKSIDNLRQDKQKSRDLEESRKKVDALLGEVQRLRKELSEKSDKTIANRYNEAVQELSADGTFPGCAKRILTIAVIERHKASGSIGIGLAREFSLKEGAPASSAAHDSHNIVAIGVNDEEMRQAAEEIEKMQGGLMVVEGGKAQASLALPGAGLMSLESAEIVAFQMEKLKGVARNLGCILVNPFLTLSFLALSVIPELKLTDKGLVEVAGFRIIPLGD